MSGPSDAARGAQATARSAVARTAQRRIALPNGIWGVALFAAGEATVFGALTASYFYLRFRATVWPPPGITAPDVLLPLALTGALVATTVPIFRAARAQRTRMAWGMIALAVLVQGGYLAVQVILFKRDLADFSPKDTSYGSIYFTLLAIHHAHVLLGILLEVSVLGRLLGGLTTYRVVAVRVVALYWYFVNAAAIVVVLTQVSPSL